MKKVFIASAFRGVLYVFWLVGVWHHAHWSVALMLSLACLRFEGEDVLRELPASLQGAEGFPATGCADPSRCWPMEDGHGADGGGVAEEEPSRERGDYRLDGFQRWQALPCRC